MKRLRLLVLVLVLLVVAALLALAGPLRGRWEEMLRALVEREVGFALQTDCSVESLSVSLFPPRADVRGFRLGADGAIANLATAHVELLPQTSLRQARPVLDVEADDLTLDLPALLHALPPRQIGPPSPVPRFRLRHIEVRDARVRLTEGPEPLIASAPLVAGHLTADGLMGQLRFAGRASPVTIEHGPRTVTLAQLEAAGGEAAVGWQLRRVLVRGAGVALDGTERDGSLHLEGAVELPRLAVIDDALARLHGDAQFEGSLEGALDAPALNATVHVPALMVDERALGDVTATARWEGTHLTVSAAQIKGFGGTASGSGTLELDEPLTSTAKITWQGLALRELAGPDAEDLPAASLDGEAELTGTLDPLRFGGTASGRVATPGGAPPVQWKGSGRYADGGNAVVELAQGNGNVGNADVTIATDGALAGTLRLRVADPDALADLAKIQSLPNMRGALETNATLSGTVRDPHFQGALNGRDLSVVGVRVDSIGGTLAGDRSAVRTDGIRAALGGGTLTARGTVALDRIGQNAWTVNAGGVDGDVVGALVRGLSGASLPIAGGKFSLDASATGPWPRVRLAGTAHIDDFWLGRERIAQLAADVQAADGAWSVDAHMRNRARQEVRLRATGRGDQDLVVALTCDAWSPTSLWQGEEAEMGGTLRATASLRGPARFLSGTATVAADDLVIGGHALGTVTVNVTADRGRWHAATNVLDDTLRLTADVRPDAGLPFTVDGAWTDADAARLIGTQHGLAVVSSGTLRASGGLDAIQQLDARIDITAIAITGGPKPVTADVPVSIVCRRGLCQLDRLTLRGGATNSLRINGEAGFDGRVRLAMAGDGTLGLLELLDSVESARGTFTVNATVTHGAAGWTALGTLNLDQVALDAGLPVAVTRTAGRLVFDGNVVRIEELRGRIGSGTFSAGGFVDLRTGPSITWLLEDVGAVPLPSLEVELGGRGTFDGTWERLRIAGDVRIARLLYDRNIELTDFLPRFNRALAAAPRLTEGTVVELALIVDAPGELYVENNLTRMEARARLSLNGTVARPVLDGRIEALDGEIYLRGRTFDLLGATVDFRPDLGTAAALNISAESLIDTPDATYVVGVRVTGTTLEPRVTLTSDDPSLSQTDIAALVAFGRTTTQMRQEGGGFSLTGALGNQVGSLISGEAEKVLPIDRIEFEPTFSTTTGAFEPQLLLGKNITEDLAASVGQTFGVSSRTRVEVSYRLGPRVSVLGSWESQTETEAGAFAGGFRLRYEFWHLTPFTLLGDLR